MMIATFCLSSVLFRPLSVRFSPFHLSMTSTFRCAVHCLSTTHGVFRVIQNANMKPCLTCQMVPRLVTLT